MGKRHFVRATSAFAVACLLAGFSVSARAGEVEDRRQFLVNLGFEDVSTVIREKLARRDYMTELNRRQMENNAVAYEVVNAARELSLFILGEVAPTGLDIASPKARELGLFAAEMLAIKPLAPSTDYPASIMQQTENDQRETALIDWMHADRVGQMNKHKAKIVSEIVALLYGRDVALRTEQIHRIDAWVTTLVERMYLDDTIGNGKYLGRTMTALLLREEKLRGTGRTTLSSLIAGELKKRDGLRLENFIGDTVVVGTDAGDKKYQVENGTMMLTRNLSPGSLEISVAAIPERIVDRWRARLKGLIGTPIAAIFMVEPEDTADGISLSMRVRNHIAQAGLLRTGFSHITYFEVKEDPATGLKMARLIDNYPNRVFDVTAKYLRTGGTRLTYPEQVVDLSHHAAVYFASPIPEKVAEWSHRYQRETGYRSEFFPSTELEIPDGITPVKNDRVVNWKTQISRAEYERMNAETDPRKLSREIWARYVRGLEETVTEGWIFHWPDPYDFYLVGATYCSQLADMVLRRVAGLPIEENKSVWHWGVRFLAHLGHFAEDLKKNPGLAAAGDKILAIPGVEKSMKVTGIKIISPSSLALQPFMTGQFYRLRALTLEQRAQASYLEGEARDVDPQLTQWIEKSVGLTDFAQRDRDVVLDYGTAMKDLEYGMVMRASRGLTTHGFSPDDFARLAVEKEGPKYAPAAPQTLR